MISSTRRPRTDGVYRGAPEAVAEYAGDEPEEAYLQARDAELDQGLRLGLILEPEAEAYRALFRRTAAARKKGNAAVLHGINVYLACGRKCVS